MTYDLHADERSAETQLRALRWRLQALAGAGSGQPPLFPEQAVSPGELASGFEQAAAMVKDSEVHEVTGPQRAALEAISAHFETLTRDEAEFGVELWTEAALASSEPWSEVRRLAAEALEAFDWSRLDEAAAPEAGAD